MADSLALKNEAQQMQYKKLLIGQEESSKKLQSSPTSRKLTIMSTEIKHLNNQRTWNTGTNY